MGDKRGEKRAVTTEEKSTHRLDQKEALRTKIQLLVGFGRVDYVPSRRTVETIIEQLIAEGRIPPREEWESAKEDGEKKAEGSTPAQAPPEGSE